MARNRDRRILETAAEFSATYLRREQYANKYNLGLNSVTALVKERRVDFFRVGKAVRIADAPPRPTAEG